MDVARLGRLVDRGFEDGADVGDGMGLQLALVIVNRGRLVLERYGATAGPDESLISWSMAKSIAHALVGVLVGEGRLDPDGRAPVPEWADPADPRHPITLDHLLRMVPGLEFVEDYVDDGVSHCLQMLFGPGAEDMGAYAASLPAQALPGTVFNYSSGTTNIVCRAMADLVGRGPDFERWMRAVLLDPLGMTSARPTFDGAGTWVGSSFLHATARDFARFGLLYLRDGSWEDRRILPPGWVDHARTPRARNEEGKVHGAHWWVWAPDLDVFACQGYECQRILVDPGADLLVVRLGKTPIEKADTVDAWLRELISCVR